MQQCRLVNAQSHLKSNVETLYYIIKHICSWFEDFLRTDVQEQNTVEMDPVE